MREPIRKPKFKYEQSVNRHRVSARRLNRKLLNVQGQIYLVQPEISCSQLLRGKEKHNSLDRIFQQVWQNCENAEPLDRRLLRDSGNALKLWHAATKTKSNPANPGDQRELRFLQQKLREFEQVLKGGLTDQSPWILPPEELRLFNDVLHSQQHEIKRKGHARNLERLTEFCRIVYWFKGQIGLREFVTSLPFLGEIFQSIQSRKKVIDWLKSLKTRSEVETHHNLWWEFISTSENRIPKLHRKELKVAARKRLKKFLHTSIDKLQEINTHQLKDIYSIVPTILTAWVVSKSNGAPMPILLIQELVDKDLTRIFMRQHAKALSRLSSRKSHPQLLEWIQSQKKLPDAYDYYSIARLFERSETNETIQWVLGAKIQTRIGRISSLKRLRNCIEPLAVASCSKNVSTNDRVHSLVYHCSDDNSLYCLEKVANWVRCFDKAIMTEGLRSRMKSTLNQLQSIQQAVRKTQFEISFMDRVREWSNRTQAVMQSFDDEVNIPKRARIWIRRLSYFQRIQAKDFRIPKSIARHINWRSKTIHEKNHLSEQISLGRANQKMIQRFEYLETVDLTAVSGESQLCRSAQESVFITGLEALQQILLVTVKDYWKKTIGPIPAWNNSELAERAKWVSRMNQEQKRYLARCISHWQEFQSDLKQTLPENRRWIGKLSSHCTHSAPWFSGFRQPISIGDQDFSLELCQNPLDVFEMGELFYTCLSVDGCYEMSVLPNAIEANKQVVYARDSEGTIVARKLIAINTDFELAGFYAYTNSEIESRSVKPLCREINRYCRNLAEAMGIKLALGGDVQSLTGLDWYDDGTVGW